MFASLSYNKKESPNLNLSGMLKQKRAFLLYLQQEKTPFLYIYNLLIINYISNPWSVSSNTFTAPSAVWGQWVWWLWCVSFLSPAILMF